MERLLLNFPARVDVLAPIHIGSGEKLSDKSFARSQSSIFVADENRLLDWVSADARRADAFIRFAESREGLGRFLTQHRARSSDFAAYEVICESAEIPRSIYTFIKSAGYRPYLPGSSLKGALRSALLRGLLLENPNLIRWANRKLEGPVQRGDKKASQMLEEHVFVPKKGIGSGKASNYDIVRALSVSDSDPVSIDQVQIVEVRVLSVQRNGALEYKKTPRGNHTMTLHTEVLQPGATLFLTLTLDRALLEGQGAAAVLNFRSRSGMLINLGDFCRRSAENLIEQELDFFARHRRAELVAWYERLLQRLQQMTGTACLLPIGWGSGYDAKTITDLLDRSIFESVVSEYRNTQRLGKPGGRGQWMGPDDTPKSRKVVVGPDGKVCPLGWLQLRF